MSKPDPAGGSLENILASIRKSLSEQSTDALAEASAAPAEQDKDTKPPRKQGLTQRLAGATAEAPLPLDVGGASDDLSDLLDDGPVKATPPPGSPASDAERPAAATGAASGEKDPLWFLTRRDEPAQEAGSPPAGAAAEAPPAAAATFPAEPKLTRPEVLRASMPPFFGSSAEAKPPLTSETTAASPHVTRPQSAAPAAPAAQVSADAGMAHEVSLLAAAAEAAAARPPPAAPQPALNGKGPAVPSPEPAPAGDTPHTHALEVMVLDLLKPMLRQWLDENMPRMVAEALSEEVQRARTAKGDAKKT